MTTQLIDTHEWYLKLKSAGFEESQADVLMSLFRQTRETSGDQIDGIEEGVKDLDTKWQSHQLHMKWVLRIFTFVAVFLFLKGLLH